MTDTSNNYAQTDARASVASILRARSVKQRRQRAKPIDMASNLSDPQHATPLVDREEAVDRSSRGSNTSVPSMVDDHGSDFSVDDDQYYRTSGEQIWDTFWQSGCEEEEEPTVSPSQYPALVVPSLSLEAQQFLTSRKRPTQTQSLSVIEAPAPADNRSEDHASTRRRGMHPCRVSYSIFPPQDEVSRQRTIRARRCPPHLKLDTPKVRVSSEESPRHSLRSSASARNLRSGSASSAFSASSAYSTSTDVSMASDVTAMTTPAASPRESWDCPRTPKPTHVSQCMDFPRPAKQPSLPNLRGPIRYHLPQPRSATAQYFTQGEAKNSAVVGAVAAESYPRPLFSPPVVAPLQPMRRVPLPPVSQRLPPPVSATRPMPPPRSATRPVPPPLNLTRPLPPLPLSVPRPQTPMSAPPRPLRPDHQPSSTSFGPPLSPPRPPPFRTTSQPLPTNQQDFQPPVVSVFEWDSDADSDADDNDGGPSHGSFAKRIARGFAQIQARNNNHRDSSQSKRSSGPGSSSSGGDGGLARIRSGEQATKFRPAQSRARALTVEDIRRVEEDMEDMENKLRLAREQVARDRCSVVEVASPKAPAKQKSALFGRMLGWRTQ